MNPTLTNPQHDVGTLHVLELGHAVRAAYCCYLFLQLGAEVTKVVRADDYPLVEGGDAANMLPEDAATAIFLDRGKTVVRAGNRDVTGPTRRDTQGIDVLVAGQEADIEAYAGASSSVLRQRHPELIVAVASTFGERGQYGRLVGAEPEAFALSGLMAMIGERGREPLRIGGPQAEHAAALSLFTAVTVALYQRNDNGMGTRVTTSAVRSTAYLDWKSHAYYADDGTILQRGSSSGPFVLTCSDGFVGFYYRVEEWPAVKRLVGDERLEQSKFATQLDRDRNRTELLQIVEEFSRQLTRDELYHRSQKYHIPAGSVLALDELHDDPQLCARRFLRSEEIDGFGSVTRPEAPWTVNGVRGGAS